MAKLQPVYLRYSTIISRADFWVLAANTAVLYASTTPYICKCLVLAYSPIKLVGVMTVFVVILDVPGTQFFDINGNDLPTTTPLHLPFRYGRVDSAACNDAGALPNATFSFADMQRFFSRFDMNVYEIVAIMGAHSLGRCFLDNSGFDGGAKFICIYTFLVVLYICSYVWISKGWTLTQSSFGNHYYTRMFEALFINANKSNVWTPVVNQRGPDMSKTLLLKPDVELLYHTFPSSTPSSSSSSSSSNRNPHPQSVASTAPTNPHYCSMFGAFVGHKQCPIQALTNSIVMKYISNITAFYTNFATAYQKLTEVGYNLTELDSAPFYDYPLTPPFSPSRTPSFPSH